MTAATPRQVSVVGGAPAWTADEMRTDDSWIVEIGDEATAQLVAAVRAAGAADRPFAELRAADYDMPAWGLLGEGVVADLVEGRGFTVLRGVPVHHFDEREAEIAHWLIGQHVGIPIPQNNAGDLVVHVRDQGVRFGQHLVRGYQTNEGLDFHVDSSDVVALLCRQAARIGGASAIIASTTIHDRLAVEHPDLLAVLYEPFWFDRRSGDGPESFYQSPVFSRRNDRIALRYGRSYIESAGRGATVPELSSEQIAALDAVDEILRRDDLVLHMDLEPGDMQFLNNYVILHARTAYEDWPEAERRRDMIRLWITLAADLDLDPLHASGGITSRKVAFAE